jgi:arylsulfatase A-like enzyme/Flp pilus assembly protein TadD
MFLRRSIFRLALAAAVTASYAGATNGAPVKTAAAKARPRPNVILITIDTLRADHVGCYGAQQVKTPTLDRLAADGVVFERAISQVPLTWPSHAVILTGTYPFQNGVQDFTGQPLAPQFRTVAQAFQHAGYATGAVVSAFVLDRSWGLGRGFDFYDDAFSAETFQKKDIGLVDRRADESVTHVLAWLKKTPRRPFFLWLHLYDPHSPYDPPEPYRTEYRGHLYDGEIAYADHELGRLMTWLKQNKLYDSSLIVALSDHGESLGEHGEDEHGFFLYNATVHVPLIVKPPSGRDIHPTRRREPVETTAVASSLLEMAGVKDSIQGQLQSPGLFDVKEARRPAYSETFYPFSSFGWSPLHALETERFHYIDAPKPELYDLENDPGESRNLFTEQPATVAVLKEKTQQLLAHNPYAGHDSGVSNLDSDTQEKLRALGYFGFRAAVSPESLKEGLADPKDKLREFNAILRAQDAFRSGNIAAGEATLAQVQQADPNLYIVPFMLGESALRQGEWDHAVKQLQRCLDLNPNFDQAMTGLANALARLGRTGEAEQWVQKALKQNPENYRAWYELGRMKAKTDPAAALNAWSRALLIQPNFAFLQRDFGTMQFREKNYREAADHLARAAQLGLNEAPLYNLLGISFSQTGQLRRAMVSFQKALRLDPNLAEAHLNLGLAYQHLSQAKEAAAEYEKACTLSADYCRRPASSGVAPH